MVPPPLYPQSDEGYAQKLGVVGLDFCVISKEASQVQALIDEFRAQGHRVVLTDPLRLPQGTEWEAFNLVLVDLDSGLSPEVFSTSSLSKIIALCDPNQLNDARVLRTAMQMGATDLLPRNPSFHGWNEVLQVPQQDLNEATIRFFDPTTKSEREIYIDREGLTLGRDPVNQVVFPHAFVSRRHARIRLSGSRYIIEDQGSRHGTLINDRKIEAQHVLQDGDAIKLGGISGPHIKFEHSLLNENTIQVFESTSIFEGEAVNREVRDIAVLLETFLSLKGGLVLEEILELVLTRSIEFVDADRGVLLLSSLEDESVSDDDFSMVMGRNSSGQALEESGLKISRKIPRQVLETGKGVIFDDLVSDDAYDHQATMSIGIASAMCVPLRVRQNFGDGSSVIGVLYVDSSSRGRPFSPRALDALEVLASEVANAIYSARLYEDSLNKQKMDEEMVIARQIQENIFKKQIRRNEYWEICGDTHPTQQVGGDFISSFDVDPKTFAVVLGDVSGKGVPAALFSTMLLGLFNGLVRFRPEMDGCGQAIAELNKILVTQSNLQKFVTSIFAFLGEDGQFRYVNAGHNPGMLLRTHGELELLNPCGTILGMFPDADYKSEALVVAPGESLILYSDGITESRNRDGEPYELARLENSFRTHQHLSAEEQHKNILNDFHQFLNGQAPLDDVTLLAIKRFE